MRMRRQLRFTLALSILYGLSAAASISTAMVNSTNGRSIEFVSSIVLLVGIALTAGFVSHSIRKKKSAQYINLISVAGFTILRVASVLLYSLPLTELIFPSCVFVGFLLLPFHRDWLSEEKSL